MSRTKNPTLRRRTRELSECAEDARECQLLGYELKDLGSLLVKMAIHMEDLQRKVDSQAEYIKTLNEDRKTEPKTPTHGYMWICPKCGLEMHSDYSACHRCGWDRSKPKTEPQTVYGKKCGGGAVDPIRTCYPELFKTEPQTDNSIGCSRCEGRYDCLDRDMPHAVHCNNYGKITDEPQTDDAYFLKLMGAVERGEISDAEANQAWYEYINHKTEPQTDCAWKGGEDERREDD